MRGGFYSKFSREHEGAHGAALFKRKHFLFYLSLLQGQRRLLAAALCMTLLQAAATLSPPLVIRRVIDDHLMAGRMTGMMPWIILYFLLYASSWYFACQQRILSQSAGQRAVFQVREQLFSKLMALPLAFHEKQQKGALTSLLMNDVSALSTAVTDGVVGLVSDVVTLTAMILIMYRLNAQLTLILLGVLPIVLLAMSLLGRRIRSAFRDVREKTAQLNTQVEENFTGIRVVQSLGVQQQQEQDFSQVSEGSLQAGLKAMMLLSLVFPLTSITAGTGSALLLWYGGQQVMMQTLTLGAFAAFLAYLRKFFQPLRNLSDVYHTYLSAMASVDRIMEVLHEPNPLEQSPTLPSIPEPVTGRIAFEQVTFYYDVEAGTSHPALHHLDLHIPPGEHVGIAGATGAGKTTLVSLLMRLMDPHSGTIRLDGIPLSQIPVHQLHRAIAVVPQQVFLFAGNVRENIRFGKPNASNDEVVSAAKKAQAHDMIMDLPEGYETKLGEEGIGLSGGQRQLIALSRALLKDAPVIILDEATASMDVSLEAKIQASLKSVMEGRTTIIIAHRLSTLKNLDRICILSQGRLAACGTHDTLLKQSAHYRELLKSGSAAMRPAKGG